jgi:hypothetical protein
MKYALLLLVPFAFSGCSEAPKRLNDSYAVAGLTALKAIEGDTFVQKPGTNLVSRFTQEKIDAADALAVSSEEKHVTDTLNQIYAAKVNFNWQVVRKDRWLETVHLEERSPSFTTPDYRQHARTMANQTSQEVTAFSDQLDKCFSDLDSSLRARLVAVPASCKVTFNEAQL